MRPSLRTILLVLLAVCAVAFVAWVILSVDGSGLPPIITRLYAYPNGDKLGHLLLMGLLAFILTLALPRRWQLPALAIHSMLLAAEEYSQRFFNGRHSDWLDLACSLAGVCIFGGLALWLTRRKREPSISTDR
jgi:polysaccharide biosynthesis protein VpsQ